MNQLVRDNDGHWYVIPVDRRYDFDDWLHSEDAVDGIVPMWAREVGGSPSLVRFGDYEIA